MLRDKKSQLLLFDEETGRVSRLETAQLAAARFISWMFALFWALVMLVNQIRSDQTQNNSDVCIHLLLRVRDRFKRLLLRRFGNKCHFRKRLSK